MSKQARYKKKLLRSHEGFRLLLKGLPLPKVKRSMDVSVPKSRYFKYARRLDPSLTKPQWKIDRKFGWRRPEEVPWIVGREDMQYAQDDVNLGFALRGPLVASRAVYRNE